MLNEIVWCVVGLALLVVGAELVVRSGTALAGRLGVSPLIIGLTFVAIGTSAPELAVGVDAAIRGNGALAVGNIAGTNVVNILLILGLSAAIRPIKLRLQTLKLELPAIVLASLLLLVLSLDGRLTRTDGALLVFAGVVFTALVVRVARHESLRIKTEFNEEYGAATAGTPRGAAVRDLLVLCGGLATIVLGADVLVDAAVTLARLWHVSDAFIGLTIVAIGTSAPELVTTVVSTMRNNRDIAIGNLIGSSVYNIVFILGLTCLIPSQGIPVGAKLVWVDIPVMTVVGLACVPIFLSGHRISRREGALFVASYLVYLAYLIIDQA